MMRPPGFPGSDAGHASGWMPSRKLCLVLAAGWALFGAAACAATFAVSTIPATVPDGRVIPAWPWLAALLLGVAMLPTCALIPVPLLAAGLAHLRRVADAGQRWAAAWTAAASMAVAVEVLFVVRLVRNLSVSYANLAQPSWHALAFSIGFALAGAAMIAVLIGATRSTRNTGADSPAR